MPVLFEGFIGQLGGSNDVFFDFDRAGLDPNKARVLTAIPNPSHSLPSFDQQAELTEVYYILKGSAHAADGGAGKLQLHVVTLNKQGGAFQLQPPFLFYRVLIAEF